MASRGTKSRLIFDCDDEQPPAEATTTLPRPVIDLTKVDSPLAQITNPPRAPTRPRRSLALRILPGDEEWPTQEKTEACSAHVLGDVVANSASVAAAARWLGEEEHKEGEITERAKTDKGLAVLLERSSDQPTNLVATPASPAASSSEGKKRKSDDGAESSRTKRVQSSHERNSPSQKATPSAVWAEMNDLLSRLGPLLALYRPKQMVIRGVLCETLGPPPSKNPPNSPPSSPLCTPLPKRSPSPPPRPRNPDRPGRRPPVDRVADQEEGEFIPVEWPAGVIRLAANFNPFEIQFTTIPVLHPCNCVGDCRFVHCTNARDGVFCDVFSCPFSGNCGNGTQESTSLRLVRVRDTEALAVLATRRIEEGVVIGEYMGILTMEDASAPSVNEGYRLHFHRDADAWGSEVACINALYAGSLIRFFNHSCAPMARFYEVANWPRRKIVVITTGAVLPGEEITVSYGSDLWFRCLCELCVERDAMEKECQEEI